MKKHFTINIIIKVTIFQVKGPIVIYKGIV
jgi:hypothetical protein